MFWLSSVPVMSRNQETIQRFLPGKTAFASFVSTRCSFTRNAIVALADRKWQGLNAVLILFRNVRLYQGEEYFTTRKMRFTLLVQ
ncbi:hypothetical protein Rcae01_02733 [Novipirellula caenicola]|uniref:Uncharacterized protein n=1 Tax=Novipirellula caenicola TaxID=1536901 RepID=A0ABP9VUT8_9BACT